MIIIDLIKWYNKAFPNVERNLEIAHVPQTVKFFAKKNFIMPLYFAIFVTIFGLLFFFRLGGNPLWSIAVFFGSYIFLFFFVMQTPKVYIIRRRREIDQEVLFAGQYLLVKMESGIPFFNAIEDASRSYGVAGKYFKEIVEDVDMGTSLEDALTKAANDTPSKDFRKVLGQVINALRTGSDVNRALRSILKQIAEENMIAIKAYGKKLNSLSMFYLIMAIVLPSLGFTFAVAIISFLPGIKIDFTMLSIVLVLLAFLQYMFISFFRQIRPTVHV